MAHGILSWATLPIIRMLNHRRSDVAEAIVAVQRPAYAIEAELIGYDRMPGLIESAEDVAGLPLTMLGAYENGHLVAILGYSCDGDSIEIDRVAVHPDTFRRGLGSALLEELHRREHDATRFTVSTGAKNLAAINLYVSSGYTQTAQDVIETIPIVHFTR